MAQANVKLTVDASQATRALKGVQAQSTGLQKSFGGLKTALLGIGFTAIAKQTVFAAANFDKLKIRLKVLTAENGSFTESLKLAEQAERKFGLSATDALEGVTNLQARLAPLGKSMGDITAVFNGFNTAAILSGASAQEQAGAMRQLTQALGSGVLRGDEFNSISEQMSVILKPVAKQLGVNVGELRAMAAEGKITADVVIAALKEIDKDGGDALKRLMEQDPTMVFKILGNETEKLSIAVGKLLGPAVLDATRLLTNLVSTLSDFLSSEAGQVTFAFLGIAAAIKGVLIVTPILLGQIAAIKANFLAMSLASAAANGSLATTTTMAFATAGGFAKATAAATAFKVALAKTGIGLAVIAFGFLTTEILKASNAQKEFNELLNEGSSAAIQTEIEKTKKEIEDLEKKIAKIKEGQKDFVMVSGAEGLEQQLEKANKELDKLETRLPMIQGVELSREFEKTKNAIIDKNKELEKIIKRSKIETEEGRKQFDLEQRRNELIEKYGEDLAKQILDRERDNRELQKGVDKIKQQEEAAKKLNDAFKKVGEDIGSGITDALVGAIEGTKTLGEAAKSILNDIASSLLRIGINAALTGLFGGTKIGGFLGFANGGRPPVGKPSIVGERGPEIFVPRSAGTIIPNNKIGGGTVNNINVNVDASGMQSDANENRGKELGVALASAIQSELIKQKRPGGLLA